MFRIGTKQIVRIAAVAVVSLAVGFTAGCSRDPNVRKQKYLESGKKYMASGKYKEAGIQFYNALRIDKNYGDAHFELAKLDLKMGSAMPAYHELLNTVYLLPQNIEARLDLGNVYLAGGAPDRAEEQANAILAINPNYADAYALLSGAERQKKNNAEAMKDIQRALAIDPNRSVYHTEAAVLDAADPSSEGAAESELQKAASLDAKTPTPHLVLAVLLEKKGDLAGAEREYGVAIGISPKDLRVRGDLAGLYFREGNKEKAEQTLYKAVDDLPDNEESSKILLDYYTKSGQLDRAETTFADLSAKHPKSFGVKIIYAQILVDKHNFSRAAEVAKELTKSDGNDERVKMLNALVLINSGKVNDAFELLEKTAEGSPKNLQLQLLLARVAELDGNTTVSEASFRAAGKLDPGNMDALSGLADMAIRHNDVLALSDLADETIKDHPESIRGYFWRAAVEATRKDYDKAADDFETVLKKDPNNSPAYVELGAMKVAQGHAPEGKAMFEKGLEKDPNSVRALASIVDLDLKAKQPEQALAVTKAQIAKEPGNGAFYQTLAYIQLQTKDYKDAADSAQKAMQLLPISTVAVRLYSQAQMALGQIDPAITVWEGWTARHPVDAQALAILGSLEETKGEDTKAMDYYKKTLQLDSNNAVASNNLAYLMVEHGQSADVALTLAQTARRAMPDSPETADTLAWVNYAEHNYSAARDLLEQAAKAEPANASFQYHLGMTYSMLNDKANATMHLKKAASLAPNDQAGKRAAAELAKQG
jgi:tetratricopeptide (TPR) repeat protein